MPNPIVIGQQYRFHSLTEPTEVAVPPDGTIVKVLRDADSLDADNPMYEVAAEGDDETFPAFHDELLPLDEL